MQKETQCGTNEAFNATRRKCVPVVGASTTNTVFIQSKTPENSYTTSVVDSPTAHAVAVSDAYNYGYTVKWYEHYQDVSGTTTTLVAIDDANYTFNPTVKQAGQYVLEAVLLDLDGVNQLDTVNWTIIVSDQEQPSLSNPSPNAPAFSYPTSITSATLSMDITNPNTVQGYYYFILDDTTVAGPTLFNSAATISHSINPQGMTQGLHTLTVKLVSYNNLSNIIDSYFWLVNIVSPDLPVIQTASSYPPLSDTITVVDGIDFASGGWLDTSNNDLSNGNTQLICIVVDDSDKDNVPGADIDVEFKVAGNSIGFAPETAAGSNKFCLSSADTVAAQSYFNLANPDVAESKSLNVVTYKTGTTTQVESLTWNVVVRPKNIRPVISINGVTTSSSLGCTASTTVHYTGCSMTQSVNYNADSGDTDYADAEDTDNVVQLGITLDYDPDIVTEGDFQVFFQVKKVGDSAYEDMDGNSQYTYTDCKYSETDTSGTVDSGDKYVCNLRMDAFNNNGSIDPGDYVVTAFIRDYGDGDGDGSATPDGLGWGVSPKDSNPLTWEITVQEKQSTGTIQIGTFLSAAAAADYTVGDSWYDGVVSCGDPTDAAVTGFTADTLVETECVRVYTAVRDLERDDFNITIEMSNGILGGYSTLSSTSTVTRIDNEEWTLVMTYAEVPEWAVAGALTSATIKVTVQDKPDNAASPICFTCDTATQSFTVNVTNNNPPPTFADWTGAPEGSHFVDLSANGTIVYAGMPFEIAVDSSDYSDASQYDGVNITWQWLVSLDGGASWQEISNANSSNQSSPKLIWTPDLDITPGTSVNLRLCLGDDGTGNELTSCTDTPYIGGAGGSSKRIKEWQNIVVYPATKQLAATAANNSSGNELAQWYDETNGHLYTAYTSGTTVYVEKSGYDSNGALQSIHTLSFSTEDSDAGFTPTSIYSLSMAGLDGTSVLIAYGLLETTTSAPQYRVRRIDIQNGKFSFNYCGFYVSGDVYASGHATCQDLYDQGASANLLEGSGDVSSFTSSYPGEIDITFSGNISDANTDFPIINSLGNTVIYRYNGTTNYGSTPKVVGFCVGAGACTNQDETAAALAAAINNDAAETDTDVLAIAEEYYARNTNPSPQVVIEGPNEFDVYNNVSKTTPAIGQINVKADGHWYIPYSDLSASMQLGITRGDAADQLQGLSSGTTPGNISLTGSGSNTQEIANVYWTDSVNEYIFVATKNSHANLDLYRVDVSVSAILDASQTDVYTKGSYDSIDKLSISVGSSDYIYVANVSSITASSDYDLGMAISDVNLAAVRGNISISAVGYEQYVQDIDDVYVSASPFEDGAALVSLTTNNSNASPNNAYIIKLDYDLSGGILSTVSFNFHESNYPALNTVTTSQDTAVMATPIVQLTNKGYTNDSSVAADLSKYVTFFAFHESDTGNKIRTGFFDIEEEGIMTDDPTTNGNFPAIIGK